MKNLYFLVIAFLLEVVSKWPIYPSGGSAATSSILGEVLRNNDIQLNNSTPQTLPLR